MEKIIDKYVGGALVYGASILPKRKRPTIKRLLLIKYRAIGDSIATLPLLKELSRYGVKIDVWCHASNAGVYKQKFITKVLLTKKELLLEKKYDIVIDAEPWSNLSAVLTRYTSKYAVGFSHSLRAKAYDTSVLYRKDQHIVETYLDFLPVLGFKKPVRAKTVPIVVAKKDIAFARSLGKYIVIAPGVGAKAKYRRWFSDRWANVIDALPNTIVLIGHGSDSEDINQIIALVRDKKKVQVVVNKSLATTATVIGGAKCFIGCDSGPLHIASAMNTPSVGLFGANTPVIWGPLAKKSVAIWHRNNLVPCIDNTKMEESTNFTGAIKAMQDITVDEVVAMVKHVSNK